MKSLLLSSVLLCGQLSLLWFGCLKSPSHAQRLPDGLNPDEGPNPIFPLPQKPPTLPSKEPLPPPEQLLPLPSPQPPARDTPEIPDKVTIKKFKFEGNTVISDEKLAEVTAKFLNEPITFSELRQARSAVTELYIEEGYVTSGAFIPVVKAPKDPVSEEYIVTIQVIEGSLEDIRVTGNKRLKASYIQSRLKRAGRAPLNQDRLLKALQLLQLDPLIEDLSAELSASAKPGLNVLEVNIKEADSLNVQVSLDNFRSPSIGGLQRQIQIEQLNLIGLGDAARLNYANTDGSNQVNFSYTVPVNAKNGTVGFNFSQVWSRVIEEPFDILNIRGVSRDINAVYRQPILRSPNQELALSLTAGRRESETFIRLPGEEQMRFQFEESGADAEGRVKVTELRFAQEYTRRNQDTVFALRSEFALGADLFNATDNPESPDGQFFLWRGQGQWVKRLAPETLLLVRSNLQFADRPLPSLAQFGLGGGNSVRGYRQDLLLVDNGVFGSAEVRIPILRVANRRGILQIVPFLDVGHGWNQGGEDRGIEGSNTLLAGGLGLRWQWSDLITARLDWGIPFIGVGTQSTGFDNSRVFFSITGSPF